ncbi:hypothetical protein HN592_01715 [Candidatus Woesearchaeota archaeon]|nr:hypothetical protein [Candidatus Woesearchaeota archaeon]MBT4368600.1 hypothetical protein [Candidatus Woesearchaeota archaeon]MBT4713091.1 hypothetical protein [Candidatus Woesearchaeota archaeon]MBT6639013.1 hypothetical protein [Candidatus Woesearchaeota archaeon]MBT7134212.1 hypothetical protein [Candidatus Woesearchaeota archaeon]
MNKKPLLVFDDVLRTYKSEYHGRKAFESYMSWFPLIVSPCLAGIVADLMCDGHLQGKKWRFDYTSNSIEELERFNRTIHSLFKVKGKVRKCTTNKYETFNLGVNNSPLARVLKLLEVPAGAKVLSSFSIPDWILADKTLFGRFINRLVSCEGSVDVKNKCIDIRMSKSEDLIVDGLSFFKDIQNYLWNYFEIKTTNPFLDRSFNLRKDGIKTKTIRLKIKRKESLITFNKFIGIDDKIKNKKLKRIIG